MSSRHDALRWLASDLAAHRLSRRDFVRRARVLGVSGPLLAAILRMTGIESAEAATTQSPHAASLKRVHAEENTLVVSSWGGGYGDAQRAAQFEPFTKETGIEVVLAPQQPEVSLIEAQVSAGKVEWDLAENTGLAAFTLAGKGLLEAIDYSQMDQTVLAGVDEAVKAEHSIGIFYWPFFLGYNTTFFEGAHPTSWAEFWDIEQFPQPRTLTTMDFDPPPLEIAVLAQGVTPEELYPLDIDAAFKSLDEIRAHITKWSGFGANATDLLVQGEVAMGSTSGGLITAAKDGAPVEWEWNQGLLYYDAWVIPKGAPHVENALRFIEFCMRPDVQANLAKGYLNGPVVPAALDLMPPDLVKDAPSNPEHLQREILADPAWWAAPNAEGKTNLELVYDKWATWYVA